MTSPRGPRVPGRYLDMLAHQPPAEGEHRCPWGKWKHLVLARPVHVSAGPHELAGDACTEENRRPQRWPTSFLPTRDTQATTQKHSPTCSWLREQPATKGWPPSRCTPGCVLCVALIWVIISLSRLCWADKIPSLFAILEAHSVAPQFWFSSFLLCGFQK